MNRSDLLSFEEIVRIARIFVKHGVQKIRLTGGEPTVRKDLPDLVSMLKQETKVPLLALTTNASRLTDLASPLKNAGIQTVNISLDTLKEEKFNSIVQRKAFRNVMKGIDAALEAGFDPVKINAVVIRSFNLDEISDLVQFGVERGIIVRFIELMPFAGNNWEKQNVVTMDEILTILQKRFELKPIPRKDPSQTALEYSINGDATSRVGFIASVSHSFCQWCNRIRITADGKIRPCLHSPYEVNIKEPMRKGIDDNELERLIASAIWNKSPGHDNFLSSAYHLPVKDRPMMRIGG